MFQGMEVSGEILKNLGSEEVFPSLRSGFYTGAALFRNCFQE
jgi:hypothetical protein